MWITVSAYFDAKLARLLLKWSDKENKKVAHVVREAVAAYLAEREESSGIHFDFDADPTIEVRDIPILRVTVDEERGTLRVS